jgi:hypothetical protein
VSDADADLDGLPDWWEAAFGTDADGLEWEADQDGDGLSEGTELLLGTSSGTTNAYTTADLPANPMLLQQAESALGTAEGVVLNILGLGACLASEASTKTELSPL